MDTESIQITVHTPVEVEFKFFVKDLKGRNHPAIIRYHYPLFFKEYFSRAESILANTILEEFKPKLTYDTLYCFRKKAHVYNSIHGLRFWDKLYITLNQDLSSLSLEEVGALSNEEKLKSTKVLLPLYVQYNGDRDYLLIPHQNYNYPIGSEWDDLIHVLLNLSKYVNGELSYRDYEQLCHEVCLYYSSFCIIDSIIVPEDYIIPIRVSNEIILEYKQYKNIPGTTKTYRIDAANTNTMTQKHIHVFYDGKQLYAINVDGTSHDGSKYILSKKDQSFLKDMGFTVPKDGILEKYSFQDGSLFLICE